MNFIKMYFEKLNTVNGVGYRLTSKPRKLVDIAGIIFNVSRWIAGSQSTPAIDSGFAQEITEEQYQNMLQVYPDGYVWWNGLGGPDSVTMSESEYQDHTQPQPQQPSTTA